MYGETPLIEVTPYKRASIERGVFCLRGSKSQIIPAEPLSIPLRQHQLVMSRHAMEFRGSRDDNMMDFGDHHVAGIFVFKLPPEHRDKGRLGAVIAGWRRDYDPGPRDHIMDQYLAFSDDGLG